MVAALGVDQAWLFTSVFALGAGPLAALAGALQLPRDAVAHDMDLRIVADAFVVVVVGGQRARRVPGRAPDRRLTAATASGCSPRSRAGPDLPDHGGGPRGPALGPLGRPDATRCRARDRPPPPGRGPRAPPRPAGRGRRPPAPAAHGRRLRRTCWSRSSASRCSPRACTSSWARAAWSRSGMPPTSASAPMAPASWSSISPPRWSWHCSAALAFAGALRSAGSACAAPGSTSRCSLSLAFIESSTPSCSSGTRSPAATATWSGSGRRAGRAAPWSTTISL